MGPSPLDFGLVFAVGGVCTGFPLVASLRAETQRYFSNDRRNTKWYTSYYTMWIGALIFTIHAALFGLAGYLFLKDDDGGDKYTAVGWLQLAGAVLLIAWLPTLLGTYHRGSKSGSSLVRAWIALLISTLHTVALLAIAITITTSDGLNSRTTPIVLYFIAAGLSLLEWVWNILLIAGGEASKTYTRVSGKSNRK